MPVWIGRNDRCPCGSGSKYKACCGAARTSRVWSRKALRVAAAALVMLGIVGAAVLFVARTAEDPRADAEHRANELLVERATLDESVWADERLAQGHEATFVSLWDALRAAEDKFDVLAGFEFDEIEIGEPDESRELIDGIFLADLGASPRTLDRQQWIAVLDELNARGFRLVQSEWHHATFEIDTAGRGVSTFNVVLYATNAARSERYQITGPIRIGWSDKKNTSGHFVPASIDATDLSVVWRRGQPTFEEVQLAEFSQETSSLLGYDLDDDGLTDLVYPADNRLFWNRGDFRFEQESLVRYVLPSFSVLHRGVFADFTGDGRVDYLTVGGLEGTNPLRYGLFLYEQDDSRRFSTPPWGAADPDEVGLLVPSSFAVGDVDGDHDLDVYIGQYKNPYESGQFPEPYYDANDGYPAYLLLNRGDGHFLNASDEAGLTAKRFRRNYGSSLVDLDDDGDLDLLTTNDFAGIGLYFNDGRGRFTDVTNSAVDVATNFGMSHTFADFNIDGRLDFYVTGMASTTARRLEQMGLMHPDKQEHTRKRMEIGYGNRMYLADASGRYRQPAFRDSIARSGWTWGVAAFDVNNDSYPDIYAANGHISGSSATDYCTRFWTHDIYAGSREDRAQMMVFANELAAVRRGEMSWNGFEHNHLFLNLHGQDFANIAFLMGVAMEDDSRAVIADDFDADGRVDLVVSSRSNVTNLIRLHLFRNRGEYDNHWIGVRLRGAPGLSPLGARITVVHGDSRQTAAIVTGDSFKAQHASVKHFGLGTHDAVESVEVRWPNGKVTRLSQPAIDRYHTMTP